MKIEFQIIKSTENGPYGYMFRVNGNVRRVQDNVASVGAALTDLQALVAAESGDVVEAVGRIEKA